jgi:hypothetical protein
MTGTLEGTFEGGSPREMGSSVATGLPETLTVEVDVVVTVVVPVQ